MVLLTPRLILVLPIKLLSIIQREKNYQGKIIYAPVTEQDICLRFSFIDSSNGLEYQENILTTTDVFGMVNLIIENDIQIGGYAAGFSGILWDGSPKT